MPVDEADGQSYSSTTATHMKSAVRPELVGKIEYRAFTLNRTTSGVSFRHPSWRGLRWDRNPREVGLPIAD